MTKRTKIIIAAAAVLLLAFVLFWPDGEPVTEPATDSLPVVEVTSAANYAGQATISLIGTVRAFSEAAVTAEQAGRVTSVPVRLGQEVRAGQVIATLSNASERAAVLQAEGSYDAALAAAAQNGVGTEEAANQLQSAKNNAVTTYKTAYGTANTIVLTNIDKFFANPAGSLPGLRLDGRGYTQFFNSERVAYQSVLPVWESNTSVITTQSDLETELAYANTVIDRTINLLDTFISVLNDQDNSSRYTDAELVGFITEFSNARSSLINTQASLNTALTQINAAEEAVARATLAATGGTNSAADAQVKQALGGLRAAQAVLAKTIIRSPIAGTVNNLAVRTGDFVGGQQQVAEVANNNALEVVTSINEKERAAFAVGDTVQIERSIDGTITEIAPAVDAGTGKIEVRVAAESSDLQNGDTVSITRQATTSADTRVFVPLSAVKFEQTNGTVFLVADGTLQAQPVTLGLIRGASVEVLDGITADTQFVVDARGLQAGTAVEVSNR